jgi:ABC-type ATPase with predicted acetyltransferase domain
MPAINAGSTGTLAERACEPAAYIAAIERFPSPCATFPLIHEMIVELGSRADWELLHELHYKTENLPLGPKIWRLRLGGETIGVCLTSCPKGLLKERHVAFPAIKPRGGDSKVINTQRYNFINANFRVISRCVVDTMYRGIGAGTALANLATRLEGKRYMEIQSSMSKFNYFAQKAGFKFVAPMNAAKYEKGVAFFRQQFEATPQDFEAILSEIEAMSPERRERAIADCKEFYYNNSALEKTGANRDNGSSKVEAMDIRLVIKNLQQITLASPMYGILVNPDFGRKLPESLPLSAFWTQKPNQPLSDQWLT